MNQSMKLSEEEEWDLQMQKLEEVDRLTSKAEESIPTELKSTLLVLIKKFPGLQRIPAFHLMGHYNWALESLMPLSDVLHKIPTETILPTIDFLLSLVELENVEYKLHYLGLKIFNKLKGEFIVEWTRSVSLEDGHFLITMARHFNEVTLELMIYNIHELTLTDMITMIYSIQSQPERKACDLCRQKRLYNLEYRMRADQLPAKHLPTPGIIPYLDRNTTMWGADDEKMFSFDTENGGQIFWNHTFPVNLVDICEKCLMDAHQAITNQGRFDPIYNIDVSTRKEAYAYHRQLEQGLAMMVVLVAKERKYRRLREFAIEALEIKKKGLKQEDNDRQLREAKQRQEAERLAEKLRREELNRKALASDLKWAAHEKQANHADLEKRKAYTFLKYHLGFDDDNKQPPALRKRKSWRLADFDEAGLPLTLEAASQYFGRSQEFEVDDTPQIDYWKVLSRQMLAKRKEKEALLKQQLRAKELEELQTLRNYVNERMIMMERYHLQKQHIAEEFEKNRLQERAMAREARRHQRFEEYLNYERQAMGYEDYLSYQLREYEYEQIREGIEREGMFNEELEQTEIDRFWGFDTYQSRFKQEEHRLQDVYIDQLREKNRQLSLMQCIERVPRKYFTNYLPQIAKASQLIKADQEALVSSSGPFHYSRSTPAKMITSASTSILKLPEIVTPRDNVSIATPASSKEDYSYRKVQFSPISHPMKKKETESVTYDDQYELNKVEQQKHIQYVKQLKAEELRKLAKTKLRSPLYSKI